MIENCNQLLARAERAEAERDTLREALDLLTLSIPAVLAQRDRKIERTERERDALREALEEWSDLGDLPGGGFGGTLRSRTAAALAAGGSDE